MNESQDKKNKLTLQESDLKIIIFELGGEHYGLDIHQVREISAYVDCTPIPNSPDYILGLIDLRGEIIVLMDLQKKFKLVETDSQREHIVVCQLENDRLGIAVDKVKGIIPVARENLKEPEEIIKQKIGSEFLLGMIIHNEKVMVVLNIENLVGKEKLQELSNVSQKQEKK